MAVTVIKSCPVCGGEVFSDFLSCRDHFVSGELFLIKACSGCGFKITYDAPAENTIGQYYQSEDYISHSDTSKGLVNRLYHIAREFMSDRKRRIVEKNSREKKGTLLDIGAGTGYFAAHMKKYGWEVSGTEISKDARDFAQKELGVSLFPADELARLQKDSFEVITLWHVLEHFHNLQENIVEIKRILMPGGTLFVALPNHTSYDAIHYNNYWAAYDVPRHLWHFAPKHVKQLFEKSGFSLVKIYRMPLDSFYISMMSEKYKKSGISVIKGIFYGGISWLTAIRNKGRCSSLIYIFR